MRYRPELDGIRALAVLLVVAHNAGVPHAQNGWVGVDVFFVLSGFLITALLLSEFERAGTISLRRFYGRRALRLYPALLAMLLAGAFFWRSLSPDGTPGGYALSAAAAAAYLNDLAAGFGAERLVGPFGQTWSLGVEEQFYLLWPLALIAMLRLRRGVLRWTALACAIAYAVLAALAVTGTPGHNPLETPDGAYFLPWSRSATLLLGCCTALLLRRGARLPWLEHRAAGPVIVAAFVALVAIANTVGAGANFSWESPAFGLVTAALIWNLSAPGRPSIVQRALSLRPLVWLGRRSYGVYVYHFVILGLMSPWLITATRGRATHTEIVLVVLAMTLAAAALSYRFIETPFLRLKRRLAPPQPHADHEPVGAPATSPLSRRRAPGR